MAGGRKKFCATGADAVHRNGQGGIPNFGTSIFAQTLANTWSLDLVGVVRFGVAARVHVTVACGWLVH